MRPRYHIVLAGCAVIFSTFACWAQSFLTPDEVAMVVATLVVQQKNCGLKSNDFPLNVAVAKLGQDLVDFLPDNRYSPLVDVKLKKANEFIQGAGLRPACDGMEEILKKFLPDIFPR